MEPATVKNRILILFAHPAYHKSRVNRVLVNRIQGLYGVTFHDLYEAYPELDIDVQLEQELVTSHDVVVFHHPFFWYSTPAIMKEWQDLVLQHGWAYGSTGTALHGKTLMNAITTGGREEAYKPDGYNRFTMRELLAPLEQTASLCGMHYLPPFVVHGTLRMATETMEAHAEDYRRVLEAIRDDKLDRDLAQSSPRLNSDLTRVIKG
jgi:glutathione-regulated potassium-efflux system ancillary protein KefG